MSADHVHITGRCQLYATSNSLRVPFEHTFGNLHGNLPVFVSQRFLCLCFRLTAVYATGKVAESGEDSSGR